jgi:hypothetical protein
MNIHYYTFTVKILIRMPFIWLKIVQNLFEIGASQKSFNNSNQSQKWKFHQVPMTHHFYVNISTQKNPYLHRQVS